MKRLTGTVFVCIAFLIVLASPTMLHAQAPTPTPTPVPSDVILIPNGVYNKMLGLPGNRKDIPIGPTPTIFYQYSVDAMNVNPDVDNFKVPKMDKYASWLMNVVPFMSAKIVKDNIVPHQDNLKISGKAKRCIYFDNKPPIQHQGEVYKTENITYLPLLLTSGELLSAHTARNVVSPIAGLYNFEGPSYEINNDALPCGANDEGIQQEPKLVTLIQGFNLIGWLSGIFSRLVPISVELVSKQQTAEAERIHCLLSGCVSDGTDLSYLKNDPNMSDKKIKAVNESGGIVDAFRTSSMDTTKGEYPEGQEENFTRTNTFKTKQMENSANLVQCSLVPKGKRSTIGLTDDQCTGFLQTSCGTSLPDLTGAASACKLCHTDRLINEQWFLTEFEKQSLPNGLPELAIQILEAAGSKFNVPASMLLGVMYNEGSFDHPGTWDWTDANVKKWSLCGMKMPSCDAFANPLSGAKGPFGFLTSDWDAFKGAANEFDPTRPVEKASPCNFFDAAFAAAKEIYQDASHLYVDQTPYGMPPDSCMGIKIYKGRDRPSSCSVWTKERAALTEWQYGERICNRTITSAVSYYTSFKCQ